ncbi:putative hydrolase C777.06c [Zingiber officinale]|uniref:putative hydrolase C777.06c n=1 Tax=Zingiber officinale TaxID=94328 RepID=UPI001C4AF79B|nr:putative hydrolase C777.06c [Zingiber officinale]
MGSQHEEFENGTPPERSVAINGVGTGRSSLIFLGTGCSTAVPNARCLIRPTDPPCSVCFQSLSVPPERNPNYRCNTSLLIDYCQDDGIHNYILIDVGKTFREQVLRWFTYHKIPQVDSIILTHEHADATLGLDDIRVVQPFSHTNDIDPTPVYLTQYAMDSLAQKFPYLMTRKLKEGAEVRRVAQLDWNIIENDPNAKFVASGLEFTPLPVMHGEDYVCLGFLFGQKSRVAYISDVSRFLPSTEKLISKSEGRQLDLLILDTLYRKNSHNVHLCLPQTLDALKRICPKQALLIGMTHEFDHHQDNMFLTEWSKREGIQVQLAHDGLRMFIDL